MKIIFTFFLSFTVSGIACAQKSDQVLARVNYTYTNKTDTLKTGSTRIENMVLFLAKNASLYTSYDKIRYELSEDQKSQARALTRTNSSSAPTLVKIDRSAGDWLSRTNYLTYTADKKIFTREEIIGFGFLIEEPLVEINWKITKDTLTLSGLACTKATTNYEGKDWTVWFAPSLPFPNGPWKLQGLPGLIVQAFSNDKTMEFAFAGFEKANTNDFTRTNDIRKKPGASVGIINTVDVGMGLDIASAYFDNTIQLTTYRTTKTTRKEFNKLSDAYKKDPKGFSKAQYGF